VVALAWRGEGWAFSATASGELIWWNTEQGSVHWRYRDAVEGGVSDMAFRPVEAQLAFASPDHTVKVWEFDAKLNNFAPVRELSAHRGSVTAVAYTPDGSRLLSVGLDAWISVAAAVTGEGDREVGLAQRSGARDVAVSWDGGFVATAGQDGVVRVWDLGLATLNPTGAEAERVVIAMHAGADEQFTTGALSPDGLLAVSGAASGRVTLWDVRTGRRLKNLDVHQTGVVHTSFHGGGEELLTVSSDGQVRVWTLNGLVPAASHDAGADLGRTVNAASVAVVASSIRLLLGAGTGKVQVLERRGGEFAAGEVWEAHAAVASVALSPDGERAWTSGTAASGASEGLKGWRVQSRLLGGVTPTAQPQRALSVSPDGQRLLGGDGGGRLTVWDVREGMRSTFSRVLHADAAVAVAFVGKDLVCSAGRDERWRLVDVEHGRELRAFAEEGTVVSTDVSSDGRRVLSVRPGALRVFDLQQTRVHDALDAAAAKTRTTRSGGADGLADRELGRWFAFQGSLRAAIVLLEESRAAGASADDRLLFESYWRLGRYAAAADAFERFAARGSFPSYYMKLVRGALAERVETLGSRLGREPDLVHAVVFSPDGRAVVTSSDSGVLHLWDVASGRLLHVLLGHDAGILSVAFSPNGKRVASGDRKGGLRLWDTLSGEELHSVEVGKEYVSALAFFPGSEAVAIGCYDKTLRVLNAIDGTLRVLRKGEHSVASVAVSADGRRVAVGGSRGQVELVEVESGAVLSSWTADRSTVEGVAFLADGRLLTAGSGSRGIAVWNVATGERLSGSEKQFDTIYGFGVTPDGSRAVTAGGRGGVMIYEVATGQVVEAWRLERVLLAAAISPDGRRVVLGARDGHLIVRSVSR
jgi:WD40 repeat protein